MAAPTRGLIGFRGEQIRGKSLRDSHFDVNNKINEDKIDIDWLAHTETLAAKKIDVFVQVNGKNASGLDTLDVTTDIGAVPVATSDTVEGVVLEQLVQLRVSGTDDTPIADADGDPVYGKLVFTAGTPDKYELKFYSKVGGVETAYVMPSNTTVDFKYGLRTNLLNAPVNALVNGGLGFVEGATDAKAYLNIQQLVKDLYGAAGHTDNDGNGNLVDEGYGKSLYERIQNFISALAATTNGKGASLIGVIADSNYTGATVQDVLADLADRLTYQEQNGGAEVEAARGRDAASPNGYFPQQNFTTLEQRLVNAENITDAQLKLQSDAINKINTEDTQEVYETSVGGETTYTFVKGLGKKDSVFLSYNGQVQPPGLSFTEILDAQDKVTGVQLGSALEVGADGTKDFIHVWYKKA